MAKRCDICLNESEEVRKCPQCGMRACEKCLPKEKRSTGPCEYCKDEKEDADH